MKPVLDVVVGVPLALLLAPLFVLPARAAAAVGRAYGYVLFCVYALGRRTAQINLRRFHGAALTRADARRATLAVCAGLGQSIAEGLQFTRRYGDGRRDWRGAIRMEDDALNRRILADPRPKILVTAHLGVFEAAITFAALHSGGGAVVVRHWDNPIVNSLIYGRRFPPGTRLIEKHGGGLAALDALRAGSNVAMLVDENAGPRGIWVPFLGRHASTVRTPALLACQTGCPIVAAVAVRRPDQSLLYRAALIEPPASARGADVEALTRDIAATLDAWIREDPLQWRWIHWRWKHRPDGSQERYGRRELKAAFSS